MFESYEYSDKEERLKILLRPLLDKKIVLYGAGKRGKAALQNLENMGIEVEGFIDDNIGKLEKTIIGKEKEYKIVNCEKASIIWNDFNVIITNYEVKAVIKTIEKTNIDIRRVYYFNELLLDKDEEGIFEKNRINMEEVYDYFQDGLSKFIYKSTIEIRKNGNLGILSRTCDKDQYFSLFDELEEKLLGDNEIYVDGGAYDGDTIDQFVRKVDNKFKYIYAFEPEDDNFNKILKKNYDDRICLYKKGLYKTSQTLNFEKGHRTSSTVTAEGEGNSRIQVVSLDQLELPDEKITFIKFDIEGSELSALKGAETIIKKFKPKLAICIYHKVEDLWEIPKYIKSLRSDYKLYVRNYTDRLDEMILFAV